MYMYTFIHTYIHTQTGVAEATIKQTFRDLHAKRHQLIPQDIATKEEVDRLPEH